MNRIAVITCLVALSTLGTSVALACSPIRAPMSNTVPEPQSQSQSQIPLNGGILSTDTNPSLPEVVDPEGNEVVWVTEDASFHDAITVTTPEGGWLAGDYSYPLEEGQDQAWIVYTVIDEIDEEAPTTRINGWSGSSVTPDFPLPCGNTTGSRAGVYVNVEDPAEHAVFIYDLAWGVGTSEQRVAYYPGLFVAGEQGRELSVTLQVFDLAGNDGGTDSLNEAVACEGCGSSVAASRGGTSIVAMLFLLVGLRRRTGRS